jgi:EpsI family protein
MSDVKLPPPGPVGFPRRAVILGGVCFGAAAMAAGLKPSEHTAAAGPQLDLDQLLPQSFGDWIIDRSVVPLEPSADVVDKIAKIYDATLSRTYARGNERVMLSVAYGGDQSGRLRVHRPEACYSAQGFQVKVLRQQQISAAGKPVEVKRLIANLGTRHEPITYWIRVGEETVASNIGQRIVQMRYSLTGQIPDGLIFRVSTIGRDPEAEYPVHDRFINDLIGSLDPTSANILVGKPRQA